MKRIFSSYLCKMPLFGAVLASLGLFVWSLLPSDEAKRAADSKVLRVRKQIAKQTGKRPVRTETRINAAQPVDAGNAREKAIDLGKTLFLSDPALNSLAAEYQALIRDLQLALEDADKGRVLKTVQKLLAAMKAGVELPASVREFMARAVATCGSCALPELALLMADAEASVAEAASNTFEEMMLEADGDRDLSELICSVVPALKDTDLLESVMCELGNMRNSVRVQTAVAILESGNEEAVAALKRNVSSLFEVDECGKATPATREGLEKYGKDNPDGEDDESFYGKWMALESD